jgi:uncharacterized SAM-binding protein YcdF (DUF218 family)
VIDGTASARGRAATAAHAVAAVVVLSGVWLFASEAWRIRWPGMMVAFVAIGWPLVVAVWRPVVPPSWRWSLAMAAALVWVDLLLDWWLETPAARELAAPQWELARVAILIAVSFAVPRLPIRPLVRRARAALVALSSATVVLLAGLILFVALAATRDQTQEADAVLVLGREFFPDGSIRPEMIARVDRAADLYRSGRAPRVIVSGGPGGGAQHDQGPTEAGVMREMLVARGVSDDHISLDSHARSTEENFACSVPILAELQARRVLVVTDPWHMPRALYQGSRYAGDLELLAAPAMKSPEWTAPRARSQHLVSEAVAYLFERIRRIGGSPATCPH